MDFIKVENLKSLEVKPVKEKPVIEVTGDLILFLAFELS